MWAIRTLGLLVALGGCARGEPPAQPVDLCASERDHVWDEQERFQVAHNGADRARTEWLAAAPEDKEALRDTYDRARESELHARGRVEQADDTARACVAHYGRAARSAPRPIVVVPVAPPSQSAPRSCLTTAAGITTCR